MISQYIPVYHGISQYVQVVNRKTMWMISLDLSWTSWTYVFRCFLMSHVHHKYRDMSRGIYWGQRQVFVLLKLPGEDPSDIAEVGLCRRTSGVVLLIKEWNTWDLKRDSSVASGCFWIFWCSELNCFTLCICWSFPKVWSSAARNHHRTLHCRIRKACMSLDGWPNTTCFYLLSEIMFWPCHLISSPCSPFLPFSRWQRRQQRFLRLDCTIHVVIATSQSLVSGFILGTKGISRWTPLLIDDLVPLKPPFNH
jgi:hypothetical protein